MTISALVLTLDSDRLTRSSVLRQLGSDPRLWLGAPAGCRLPVVAETPTPQEGADLVEELFRTPGVCFVDVVVVEVGDGVDSGVKGDG